MFSSESQDKSWLSASCDILMLWKFESVSIILLSLEAIISTDKTNNKAN